VVRDPYALASYDALSAQVTFIAVLAKTASKAQLPKKIYLRHFA
jgi:hypothetical protein